jgi:dephospho-CoA kinase
MDILKIALTGGIACGKSQMAQVFAELGADVVRLDDISKQVTTPGSDGLRELVDAFGEKILNQDDELNRQVLRAILLENESNKNCIEVILHPKILKTMQCIEIIFFACFSSIFARFFSLFNCFSSLQVKIMTLSNR